ncbi:MAG: hypothetical protein Q8941_13225 [Bacteroidota bacterium]|nr:hypothetical protein [Bacteroidota bacterium]
MKKLFVPVLACLYLFQPVISEAQYYYYNDKYYGSDIVFEAGVSAGIMNSLTDIGGKKGIGKGFIKDLNMNFTKPSFSIYGIAMYRDAIGVRLEGTFGGIRSNDSILKSVAPSTFGRYERNLSFRSKITDVQLAAEVHPLFFKHYDEGEAPYWSPYLVAGIGFFSFNPEANLNGHWYALQPLHTEGQGFAEYPDRKPYKLTQINVPLGIGVKYELGTFLNARLEIVHRILFTDYLDDVSNVDYIDPALFNAYLSPAQASIARQLYDRRISSKNNQRGNPKNNDSYFTIQLKIGMTLRTARR